MLEVTKFINTYIFGPGLALSVSVCGILLLIILAPTFLRSPGKILSALRESPSEGMSPAKAMCVALSGTLGVGNISGVASAVAIGGAGAVFWMLASSLGALFIKYSETLLALLFREKRTDGFHGGAFYYIRALHRSSRTPIIFAKAFALLTLAASLTLGSSVQSNAISVSASRGFGLDTKVCAIVTALAVLLVISGGFSRIASLAALMIVPMSALYILMAIFVMLSNLELLPIVTRRILSEAFTPDSIGGGILGFVTSRAVSIGITRGIVSNEAGCGTAPIAHAGARVSSPALQGIWGMLEVFIDTVVICSLTAFVVLIADERGIAPTPDGMASAISAFGLNIRFSAELLTGAVAVFAFATMLCWYYYGIESLAFLTEKRPAKWAYTLAFILCIALGAVGSGELVWNLSDLVISLMTGVNMTAVMLYLPIIKRETDNYFRRESTNFVKHGLAKEREV